MAKHGALAKQQRALQRENQKIPANPVSQGLFFKAEGYSGPLPPPAMLAQYNNAFPGCAERIVSMAERQSNHRQVLERNAVRFAGFSETLGQILGFLIVLSSIAAGVYLIMNGKSTAGLVAIIAPIASLAAVFVIGKQKQQKELSIKSPRLS